MGMPGQLGQYGHVTTNSRSLWRRQSARSLGLGRSRSNIHHRADTSTSPAPAAPPLLFGQRTLSLRSIRTVEARDSGTFAQYQNDDDREHSIDPIWEYHSDDEVHER